MFQYLRLARPLAVIDLETTGTDTRSARIVEVSVVMVHPSGESKQLTRRLNPGIPIPAEATAVHRITDADVANEPRFRQIAVSLLELLHGCDLCGFNLLRFDLPVLQAELQRAGISLVLAGRAILDALQIFHARERRDLAAAVRLYLGREHEDGHSAAADARATAEVLDGMLARYTDLPRGVVDLHEHLKDPRAVDAEGRFHRIEGQIRFAFGKHRGLALEAIARQSPEYLHWMLEKDFSEETKAVVRRALGQSCAVSGPTVRTPP